MKQRYLVQEVPRNNSEEETALYAFIGGSWYFLYRKGWQGWWKNDCCANLFAKNHPKLSKSEMRNILSYACRRNNTKPKRPYILEFIL